MGSAASIPKSGGGAVFGRSEPGLSRTRSIPGSKSTTFRSGFIHSRTSVYVGREHLNRELEAYANGSSKGLCLLTGPGGSGKSAALAKFVTDYDRSQGRVVVISHFVRASPRSASLRDVLELVCHELHHRALVTERSPRPGDSTVALEEESQGGDARDHGEREKLGNGRGLEIPRQLDALVVTFQSFLRTIPEHRHIVIVIDAIDQLEGTGRVRELSWLPRDLEPHVRIIISAAVGPGAPWADEHTLARTLSRHAHTDIQIPRLSNAERREILRRVPAIAAKTLNESQVAVILAKSPTDNPLYLRVALEELRGFGIFERLDDRIAALPAEGVSDATYRQAAFCPEAMNRAGDPVTALFVQVIQRLEHEFGHQVARDVLGLMAAARRGLSERELRDLVGGSPGSESLFPLLRQLRPYVANRAGLISFFHGSLHRAVQSYYTNTDDPIGLSEAAARRRLAEYFQPLHMTPRGVEELPWQLVALGDWDGLANLLGEVAFFAAAWKSDEYDVREYWSRLERESPHRPLETYQRLIDNPAAYDVDGTYAVATLLQRLGHREEALGLVNHLSDYFRSTRDAKRLAQMLDAQAVNHAARRDWQAATRVLRKQEMICRRENLPACWRGASDTRERSSSCRVTRKPLCL